MVDPAYGLSSFLRSKGRHAEAESIDREVLAALRASNPRAKPARLLYQLAELRRSRGDAREGEALYEEARDSQRTALDNLRRQRPQAWPLIADAEWLLGACLRGLGRYPEAEPLLLGSYPSLKRWRGERHDRTREALDSIIDLYVRWGKPEKAAAYRAMIPPPYQRAAAARR